MDLNMDISEVPSKEEVVQILINTLVGPLLPKKNFSPSSLPSQEEQKSVAKQMHAVVVLYNYYHRKQNLELEFLDFWSFCTLAVKLRPTMAAYMKWTNECMSTEIHAAEDHLSLTEKSIKDACLIAAGLDASVDVPEKVGSWPISKVSVMFIDARTENCMVQHGAITKGVYSFFEKELDEPRINQEISSENKSNEKKTRNPLKVFVDDSELLKIGHDLVKELTGFDSQLNVLGKHISYSLTKEKSATQFYLLRGSVKFGQSDEVSLTDLVKSLQEPLVCKSQGSCSAKDAVSHYHILPYTGIISNWMSRKDLSPSSRIASGSIVTVSLQEKVPTKKSVSPEFTGPKQVPDHIDNNSSWTSAPENNDERHKKCRRTSLGGLPKCDDKMQIIEIHDTDNTNTQDETFSVRKSSSTSTNSKKFVNSLNGRGNVSLSGPTSGLSQKIKRGDNVSRKVNRPPRRNSIVNVEATNVDVPKAPQSGLSKARSQETLKTDDDGKLKSSKGRNIMGSVISEERKNNSETPDKEIKACRKASLVTPSRELESASDLCGTSQHEGGTSEMLFSRPTEIDNNGPEDGANLNTEFVGSLKESCNNQRKDEKASARNCEVGDSSDQSGTAKPVNQPFLLETPVVALQNVPPSDVLENALILLHSKRQQQFAQICSNEDMLAQYEHCIERIRDHGDVGLAQECTKSILSGNSSWMLNHGAVQIRPASKIVVPITSKCQDLENMCIANNWRLPKFSVEPSAGKFSSTVTLVSKDLKVTSKGGLESSPAKARESAAAQMIADVCKHAKMNEAD